MAPHIKYSVIIPVFNSEKTLSRCLESLVSQGREDIQIIVVDDGSSDSSRTIVQSFAEKHPTVSYFYQQNSGVSQARNMGLTYAAGFYVTFVDSDDYVKPDYFAVLDTVEDCDLLVFAHENVGGAPSDESGLFQQLKNSLSSEQRLALLLSSRRIMSPWNKRFKRQIIQEHGLHFIEGMSVGEDFNFCMAYAMNSQTIHVIDNIIICNDISDQHSLSRKYRSGLDSQLMAAFHSVAETISGSTLHRREAEALLKITDYLFVKNVFSCISEEFKPSRLYYLRDRRKIKKICQKFRKPLSDGYCNIIHWGLRFALTCGMYFPFYLVAYVVKGRKYAK